MLTVITTKPTGHNAGRCSCPHWRNEHRPRCAAARVGARERLRRWTADLRARCGLGPIAAAVILLGQALAEPDRH
jgi:hypothetical protein